jgi:hypothetical protein
MALLAVIALTASGCLIDLKLNDKSGGTGDITYHIQREWELASQKKNLESAMVQVTSAEVDKEKMARFKIAFDEITALGTTQFFRSLSVSRTVTDGVVALVGTVNPANPVTLPEAGVNYFGPDVTIAVTAPGEIVSTNAKSTDGKTVKWVYPINDLLSAKNLQLTLSYKQP